MSRRANRKAKRKSPDPKPQSPKEELLDYLKRPYVLVVLFLIVGLGYIMVNRMMASDQRLISLSVIAIIAGAFFEGRRIAENWRDLLFNWLLAFGLSILSFLPGKHESNYVFDEHIARWPYYLLGIYIVISIVNHDKKLTKKLDEGMTLVHSIAALYWILDAGILTGSSLLLKILGAVGLSFVAYSLFHAFTYTKLSDRHRLYLSVGSSVIMIFFAADYAFNVIGNGDVEELHSTVQFIYGLAQYFLLGIASIYMVHNLYMIIDFFPDRYNVFDYGNRLKLQKKKHVDRYAKSQVHTSVSLVFLLISAGVFAANYIFQVVPSHLAIWILFVAFPVIIYLQPKGTKEDVRN